MGDLGNLKDIQDDLRTRIMDLTSQMEETTARVEALEEEIAQMEEEISSLQVQLDEAQAKEQQQYESMVIRTRDMYEMNDSSYFMAILGAGGLADILNTADYFEKIASYDRRMFNDLKETRVLIETKQEELAGKKALSESMKIEAQTQRERIEQLMEETTNEINRYSNEIDDAEKRALAYEAAIREKENDLAFLKRKLEEEKRLSETAANSEWRDISEITFAEGDRYLLANLIYCEAGGEPYIGQVAVGSVVINRMLSSVFPDTLSGVIYQKSQFSPVGSGRLALALAADKATDSCYRTADEAMAGMTNVGNCLFFRTPIEGLTGISIGGHIFY